MLRILLSSDSTGAGGANPAPPSSGDNAPAPAPAPPPAAVIVQNSPAQEADAAEVVRLRRDNEESARKLKERETRVSELEDENRRLKDVPRPAAKEKKGWLEGNTFFG